MFAAEADALDRLEKAETSNHVLADRTWAVEDVDGSRYETIAAFFRGRLRFHKGFKPRSARDHDNMVKAKVNFALIREGQNPFTGLAAEYEYMRRAVDFILEVRPAGITHGDITDLYRRSDLGWSSSTNKGYATKVITILKLAGVIKKEGTVYCLV